MSLHDVGGQNMMRREFIGNYGNRYTKITFSDYWLQQVCEFFRLYFVNRFGEL